MLYTNCMDCPSSQVINDRDPDDWFCDDDVAVLCTKALNEKQNISSEYISERQPIRSITRSCRPHHVRKECDVPKWCPLIK